VGPDRLHPLQLAGGDRPARRDAERPGVIPRPIRPGYPSAPPRISASLSRLMLPPETTQTIFPGPAPPLTPAAAASAPALPGMPPARSASVRPVAAPPATGAATASSTSGDTSGHMLSSTRRLPEPATNEGR